MPMSHQSFWQPFFDGVIKELNTQEKCVFVLMGSEAKKVKPMIKSSHIIIETVHPSPLSAYRGFNESKLFKKILLALDTLELSPVDFSRFD